MSNSPPKNLCSTDGLGVSLGNYQMSLIKPTKNSIKLVKDNMIEGLGHEITSPRDTDRKGKVGGQVEQTATGLGSNLGG